MTLLLVKELEACWSREEINNNNNNNSFLRSITICFTYLQHSLLSFYGRGMIMSKHGGES